MKKLSLIKYVGAFCFGVVASGGHAIFLMPALLCAAIVIRERNN